MIIRDDDSVPWRPGVNRIKISPLMSIADVVNLRCRNTSLLVHLHIADFECIRWLTSHVAVCCKSVPSGGGGALLPIQSELRKQPHKPNSHPRQEQSPQAQTEAKQAHTKIKEFPTLSNSETGQRTSNTFLDKRYRQTLLLLVSTFSFSPSTSLFPLLLSSSFASVFIFSLSSPLRSTSSRSQRLKSIFHNQSFLRYETSHLKLSHEAFFALLLGDPSFLPFGFSILSHSWQEPFPLRFVLTFFPCSPACSGASVHQFWSQSLPRITRTFLHKIKTSPFWSTLLTMSRPPSLPATTLMVPHMFLACSSFLWLLPYLIHHFSFGFGVSSPQNFPVFPPNSGN